MVGRGLRTVVDGLDHPEGVCWSPTQGLLYAGGEAGQLYAFSLQGGKAELKAIVPGGFLLGLAIGGDAAVYACDPEHTCVQRISIDGQIERYGEEIAYPNFPVFDKRGSLWVSDSGRFDQATGGVVRIDPDGATQRIADGLAFPNGLAIKGDWLYVAESARPGLIRIPLQGGPHEDVISLERVVPDGLAFDAEGGLWIGCWQPNRVYRLSSEGDLQTVVDDWTGEYVLSPTNLAFAGDTLDVLALACLAGWAVKTIDPGVPGAPLNYPPGLGA
jgi:sugar lactone lactonase YvrE